MNDLLWLFLVLTLLLPVAGWLYQSIGTWRDRRRYVCRGRMVEVGRGRRVYVHEMAPENGDGRELPVVVFESGIGNSCQNWLHIQRRMAEYARTVSYDRAGLGWSDASEGTRTPTNLARELRETLKAAGVDGPYVVVAHSFGGTVARRFAAE